MKIVSRIYDKKINALNVLIEMSIGEYIKVAKNITEKNEFQRKKVNKSKTVYALLKEDLKKGCIFPPIVLGVKTEKLENVLNIGDFENENIEKLFTNFENFMILDGLQRTYTIIGLLNELKNNNEEIISKNVLDSPMRVEVFLGLKRIGILYRMLTLNTGQTPMSMRHQIEILYSDYKDDAGVVLYTEIDKKQNNKIGEYQFKDIVEGFNSYLNRDEMGINKDELLENIRNLEKLSQKGDTDLFKEYIDTYNQFVKKIDELSSQWEYVDDYSGIRVFGKNIVKIFTKSQALSGFGATIGILEDNLAVKGFDDIKNYISKLEFTIPADEGINNFIRNLDEVRNRAKNIEAEQQLYFSFFFRELFNSTSSSFCKIDSAIYEGFRTYKLKT